MSYRVIEFLSLSIALNIFFLLHTVFRYFVVYKESQNNNQQILRFAEEHEHAVYEEPITNFNDLQTMERCVSPTVYDVANSLRLNEREFTDDQMSMMENVFSKQITSHKNLLHPLSDCFDTML